MSGHNKWSKIKHKKAVTDAQKSKIFSKLVRLIQVEAKSCDGDIESPALKVAIEKARKENMPKENIERAIRKASEIENTTAITYEAYGPAGIGIIITGLTNNTNRISAEIKHVLSKNGCSLGSKGSVSWNFTKQKDQSWSPNTFIEISEKDDKKLEQLIDALEENDDVQDIYTNAV